MMAAGRLASLVLTGALLGGCNMVFSETALFSTADAKGQPPLRPGLWAMLKPDCGADLTKRWKTWDECAAPVTFTAKEVRSTDPSEGWKAAYKLNRGKPAVLQARVVMGEGKADNYFYIAVDPLDIDERGRIVKARIWPAECGPPPTSPAPPPPDKLQGGAVTVTPLPGLEMRSGNCIAYDRDAVRRAIEATPGWQTPKTMVWVRERAR